MFNAIMLKLLSSTIRISLHSLQLFESLFDCKISKPLYRVSSFKVYFLSIISIVLKGFLKLKLWFFVANSYSRMELTLGVVCSCTSYTWIHGRISRLCVLAFINERVSDRIFLRDTENVKAVPWFSLDVTEIWPSIDSHIFLQIVRPRPMP